MTTKATLREIDESLAGIRRSLWLLAELFRLRWKLFATVLILTVSISASYALLATPIYESKVVLAPVRQSDVGVGLSAIFSQVGDLSDLADLSSSGGAEQHNAMAILRSRAFSERIIAEFQLWHEIVPARAAKIDQPGQVADNSDVRSRDAVWLAFDRKVRSIAQDQRTGLTTVTIRLADRRKAAEVANAIASRINEEVRQRLLREAATSRQFLEKQLAQTDAVELRQAIYRLIENQIRREVVANSRPELAFALIDPAVASDPRRQYAPRRALVMVSGVLLGLLLGAVAIVVRQTAAASGAAG